MVAGCHHNMCDIYNSALAKKLSQTLEIFLYDYKSAKSLQYWGLRALENKSELIPHIDLQNKVGKIGMS